MKKRFLSIFLTLAMVLTFVPATGAAAADVEIPENAYTISVDTMEYGTVSVKLPYAFAGESVAVGVTPNDGYVLEDGTLVYSAFGWDFPETIEGSDDYYSFTMPAADVTIYASFVEDTQGDVPYYTVTVDESITGGKVTLRDGSSFKAGDVFAVLVTPDEGYELVSVTASSEDDTSHTEYVEDLEENEDGSYTVVFMMQEADAVISASFANSAPGVAPGGSAVTIVEKGGEGEVSYDAYELIAGEPLDIRVYAPDCMVVDSFTVKETESGKAVESERTSSWRYWGDDVNVYSYDYIYTISEMPDANVTVEVTYAAGRTHTASYAGGDGAQISPFWKEGGYTSEADFDEPFEAGQWFSLDETDPFVKEGCVLAGWTTDGKDFYEPYALIEDMPDKDVTFTAVWKETPYTVDVTVNNVPDVEGANIEVWAYTDDYMVGDWNGEDGFQLKLAAGMHTLEVI